MKIFIYASLILLSIQAHALSCRSQFYGHFYSSIQGRVQLDKDSLKQISMNCKNEKSYEELKDAIIQSGAELAGEQAIYGQIEEFIMQEYGTEAHHSLLVYTHHNEIDSVDFFHNLEDIVSYAPALIDREFHKLTRKDQKKLINIISKLEVSNKRNLALVYIFRNLLGKDSELLNELSNLDINLNQSYKTTELFCKTFEWFEENTLEYLSDDIQGLTYNQAVTKIQNDVISYYNEVEKVANIYQIQCRDEFLFELKQNQLDPDYWYLPELYEYPLDYITQEDDGLDDLQNKRVISNIIFHNDNSLDVSLRTSSSCFSNRSFIKELHTTLHKHLKKTVETSKTMTNPRALKATYGETLLGCSYIFKAKITKTISRTTINDFLKIKSSTFD